MAHFEMRDFSTNAPNELLVSVNNHSNISPTCVEILPRGKKTFFVFDNKLNNTEKTELDALLLTWSVPSVNVKTLTGVSNQLSEPMTFSFDATRNKSLSTETTTLIYSEAQLTNMDWIQVGAADDADSGIVMPFDGTIIRATGNCENVANTAMGIHLFINMLSVGSIIDFSGSGEQSRSVLNLNIDFVAGDKIRLRAIGGGGANRIEDTIITLWIKWRKV
ncbi:MAG: hypothetical protein HC836_44575 [Richelia sp. RM2_1_2]|nr:hypothetical protein [Richelia sp. RM2_1_2]